MILGLSKFLIKAAIPPPARRVGNKPKTETISFNIFSKVLAPSTKPLNKSVSIRLKVNSWALFTKRVILPSTESRYLFNSCSAEPSEFWEAS